MRTSSSLKKSFTLIELSIVLLILSLLVGSLLVGRQIVDRAKIQRIIFEFDYYEKAFHQFYDTYRAVPGELRYKECKKYSIFNNESGVSDPCFYGGLNPALPGNPKLVYTWVGQTNYLILYHLFKSGLIDDGSKRTNSYFSSSVKPNYGSSLAGGNYKVLRGHITNNDGCTFHSSFNHSGRIQIAGYNYKLATDHLGETTYMNFLYARSNKYFNKSLPHEMDNMQYRNRLDGHNALTLYFWTEKYSIDMNAGNSKTEKNEMTILSSKLASEIDAKIDDGRPGTGRLLALKGGIAHQSNTTNEQHLKSCYDKMANEVSSAIYHSDTNLQYGCNITYIMEDVK